MNRRTAVKVLSSLPLVSLLPTLAYAGGKKAAGGKPANLLSETKGMGKSLQYKNDASQAPKALRKKDANCFNCSKYNLCMDGDKECKQVPKDQLAKADYAPCNLFRGNVVAKKGWCLSWSPKA